MYRELIKGNEAVVKAAILAGCTHYFGYPITPASEIAHAAAKYLPLVGGTFVQAESETAAINMVYGAASCGVRTMTASSGPGISLKCEGISYLAGAELPAVIIDVMRAGPGLGNIWPEQGDYNQIVKGAGHGNYKNIVLAPASAQEMCDLTMLAFELAWNYRNPAVVFTDAYVGQMMEPVAFPETIAPTPRTDWAVYGDQASRHNLITSIVMSCELLEQHNRHLQDKYASLQQSEQRCETFATEDARLIVCGYGVVARIMRSAVEKLRADGLAVGLFRPITLQPFPVDALAGLASQAEGFLVVELSNGQMVDDVRLAIEHRKPVRFYNRMGGMVPSVRELVEVIAGVYSDVCRGGSR